MPGKPTLNRQGIMMKAEDDISLRIEKERGGRSAWFEAEIVVLGRDAGCWRF
jgi:hypothetical protein